jgi:protein-tyrosine phosphatase
MFLRKLFGRGTDNQRPAARIGTDIHSHLIPEIDDGAKSVEDSLSIIRELSALGFNRVITTPHIMADSFPNTPDIIHRGLAVMQEAIAKEGIPMKMEAAAEYYLDEIFEEKLLKAPLLTFGGDKKYVLFETSYVARPMSLERIIFDLQMAGYQPVLAHPERYRFFWERDGLDLVREIADKGVHLQLNIASMAGSYDVRAGKLGKKLLKEGLIHFLGTDIHRLTQADKLKKALHDPDLIALVESGTLLNHKI